MGTTRSKNSCKTAVVVNLLSRRREDAPDPAGGLVSPAAEPEAVLAEQRDEGRLNELARCIRERDREDQQLANVMLAHAVEKGRWLTEAKAMVPYGEWGNWLKEKVDYSQSKAQGLMKLYQKFGDEQESLFGRSSGGYINQGAKAWNSCPLRRMYLRPQAAPNSWGGGTGTAGQADISSSTVPGVSRRRGWNDGARKKTSSG